MCRKPLKENDMITIGAYKVNILSVISQGGSCLVYKAKISEVLSPNVDGQGFNDQIVVGNDVIVKEFYPAKYNIERSRTDDDKCSLIIPSDIEADFDAKKADFVDGQMKFAAYGQKNASSATNIPFAGGSANNTCYVIAYPNDGNALEDLKGERASWTINHVATIMKSVCCAIYNLHKEQKLYLDLKPSNIWYNEIDDNPFVRLFDFDTVSDYPPVEGFISKSSEGYAAPEQINPRYNNIGYHTDAFAIGAVFYWLLTGNAPSSSQPELDKILKNYSWMDEKDCLIHTQAPGNAAKKLIENILKDLLEWNSATREENYGSKDSVVKIYCRFSTLANVAEGGNSNRASIYDALEELTDNIHEISERTQSEAEKAIKEFEKIIAKEEEETRRHIAEEHEETRDFISAAEEETRDCINRLAEENKSSSNQQDEKLELIIHRLNNIHEVLRNGSRVVDSQIAPSAPTSKAINIQEKEHVTSKVFPEGRYVGWLENGLRHGMGKIEFFLDNSNGYKSYDGEWRLDTMTGNGILSFANGDQFNGRFQAGKRSGKGIYSFANGDKYEGEFKDDMFHGHGVESFVNTTKYDGEYIDGKRNGHFVVSYANGDKYEGEFRDDKKNGHGIYTSANNDIFEGEYRDGKRNGHFVVSYADGDKYEGEFRDDKKNGHGIYTSANNDIFEGEYRDGKRNGHGIYTFASDNKYEGEFKDDKYHGHGVETFANGNKYEGEYRDGKRNGHGIYTFANDNKYEGEFKDNKFHGHGIYTFANGNKYEGEFKDDKFHGNGIMTYANGIIFQGEYQENEKNGKGTLHLKNGDSIIGNWEKDQLMEFDYILVTGVVYSVSPPHDASWPYEDLRYTLITQIITYDLDDSPESLPDLLGEYISDGTLNLLRIEDILDIRAKIKDKKSMISKKYFRSGESSYFSPPKSLAALEKCMKLLDFC